MRNRQTRRAPAWAFAAASACFGLAAPAAFAQEQAVTSQPVDLYAGPSGDYPVVSEIDQGAPVEVMGCLSDYSWCDVVVPGLRGWVYGGYLTYPYQGGYVPVQNYGAVIGVPVVTFVLGTYWGSFYRDRPWYGERDRWAHVPPPGYGGRPPGPPPPVHAGPPGGGYHPPAGPGGPPPGAPHGPPPEQGNVAHPPAPAPGVAPARPPGPPPAAARPPAPAPQQYAHPGAPQPAYGHPPGPPPANVGHAPGPAPGNAPHPSGHEESGHSESRQQN
jgi:uncharacterized protein YraI